MNAYELSLEEARIAAWFLTGLRRETARLARRQNRVRQHELLILNQRLHADSEETEMIDQIAAANDTPAEMEDLISLEEVFKLLTFPQQAVIKATILEGTPEQEVALQMGTTKQAVNRMKGRALRRLRKYFEEVNNYDF
ncbi:sigma-70 RNA polymerase sigma factor region 4 domain-containing protein [Effusibacillus pohliae]|uniref:sigma-70 family RNA polymerase sigma factor n=1 Tax=Effusibacillus pohliae TaxID=232270 RepID=UPI00035F2A1E|nr:sigma-70 family RNA polymerase sigma factor [Effusibacillus pohliae]